MNLILLGSVGVSLAAFAEASQPPASKPGSAQAKRLIASLPLRFEQDSNRRWTSRGPGYAIRFQPDCTLLRLPGRILRLSFTGSNPRAKFEPREPSKVRTNYFIGKQYRSAEGFSRLERESIYRGIDIDYYGDGQRLEYDFTLRPGADASRIRMRFEGADDIRIDDRGDLVLTLDGKELVQRAPTVYQKRGDKIIAVESRYRMMPGGDIGVALGSYDRAQAVVIDPALVYGLYLTATDAQSGVAIALDSSGNVYLGGWTYSNNFPIGANGIQTYPVSTGQNSFIWVVNPFASTGGSELIYSTYFGGNLNTSLTSLAVDNTGLIYFGGPTISSNLPVTSGAYATALSADNAEVEGYVAVIDSTQSGAASLNYCSYYAGSMITQINGVATMGGRIYVTGFVNSNDLPVAGNSFQPMQDNGYDAFVAEFDPTQSGTASLLFASYLGGYLTDVGTSIAVDQSGLIYIAGWTVSTDFPTTTNAYQPVSPGAGDAFLAQIDPVAGVLLYSTYLGGSDADVGTNVVVGPGANVTVAGYTFSPDFPVTTNAYQAVNGGAASASATSDAFITTLNLAAQSLETMLVYSTYYGGNGAEVNYGLALDSAGRYYICGYTLSLTLPVSSNAYQPASIGQSVDGYLAVIDPSAGLVYGSYITGPGIQQANAIAADSQGHAYVTGQTTADIFNGSPPKSDPPGSFDVFFGVYSVIPSSGSSRRERIQTFGPGSDSLPPLRERRR
ncbi:MAG TPA: SBBP repeat-containing protein [Bryobacteraceae bacterium]